MMTRGEPKIEGDSAKQHTTTNFRLDNIPHVYDETTIGCGEWDVLPGRGKGVNLHHKGNRRYREIVVEAVAPYIQATSQEDKRSIIDSVIARVEEKGRFLQPTKTGKEPWIELKQKQKRKKIVMVSESDAPQNTRSPL